MVLKERLRQGEKICGIMLSELYTPNIVRILANCGFYILLIDCEHGYFDKSQVANLISVADGHHLDTFIRVSYDTIGSVAKYMDMGARGILLSNTTRAAQARELVERCLYAPQGDRGVSTFRAHTNYCNHDILELMKKANESNLLMTQIESPDTLEQLDEICAVDGLDGILIGPNDLTQRMGIYGRYDAPPVQEILRACAKTAGRHGKWSGIITADHPLLRYCEKIGMTCFSTGSELNALANGARSIRSQADEMFGERR